MSQERPGNPDFKWRRFAGGRRLQNTAPNNSMKVPREQRIPKIDFDTSRSRMLGSAGDPGKRALGFSGTVLTMTS